MRSDFKKTENNFIAKKIFKVFILETPAVDNEIFEIEKIY